MAIRLVEIDVEKERQALAAACKGAGAAFQELVHAVCTAEEIQPTQLKNPVSGYAEMARSLLILFGTETRCGSRSEIARVVGLRCVDLPSAVNQAREYLAKRPERMVGWMLRKTRQVIESRAIGCEVVVLGREVFGLSRKRERSRLLSRTLCRYVAEKVAQLNADEGLFRGWRLVGQLWQNRPNARKELLDRAMRYLVLLIADGDGPRDSRLKGLLMVSKEKAGLTLSNFYIEPEFRGHGWGRKMLEAVLCRCRKDSDYVYGPLCLEVNVANEAACRLYQSVGFKDWTKTMELESFCDGAI